ncbi:MAG: hypothetical protein EBR02_10445, partial [Alphaproteobacteria bacterium]|nr:hypothetical protein [Alphaproteobacteria bacterium]
RSLSHVWVPDSAVTELKSPAINPEDWVGYWQEGEKMPDKEPTDQPAYFLPSTVKIKVSTGDRLDIHGVTFWHGAIVAYGEKRLRNKHYGEFKGDIAPAGVHVKIGDITSTRECGVVLRLLTPDYLAVSDNSNCGGVNARFDGVYHRVTDTSRQQEIDRTGIE